MRQLRRFSAKFKGALSRERLDLSTRSQRRDSLRDRDEGITGWKPVPRGADLWLLSAVAAALRFWGITGLGLTHFDEGSYAQAGRWIATLGAGGHPIEPVHAPPLYPILVGIAFFLGGTLDWVAIAVSAVAGTVSMIPVYALGHRWFDRPTAFMASAFWLTSAYGWFYSRMALTDSLFCLLFWSSLYWIDVALEQGGTWRCLRAGMAAGLCWNTKYHGFLVLVIAAIWLLVEWIDRASTKPPRGELSGTLDFAGFGPPWKRLLLISAMALGSVLPWFLVLATAGKLPEVGASLWDHSLGAEGRYRLSFSAMILYLAKWTSPALLLAAAASALAALLASLKNYRRLVIVALFWIVASLGYRSFPRLLLPLVPALCLAAAAGIQTLGLRFPGGWRRLWLGTAAVLVLGWNLVLLAPYINLQTDAYRRAAAYVRGLGLPRLSQCNKNYYFYDTHAVELREATLPELDQLSESVLIFDPILNRFPAEREWVYQVRPHLRPFRRFSITFYPPNRYQGYNIGDPYVGDTEAPFRESKPVLEVWRVITEGPKGSFMD